MDITNTDLMIIQAYLEEEMVNKSKSFMQISKIDRIIFKSEIRLIVNYKLFKTVNIKSKVGKKSRFQKTLFVNDEKEYEKNTDFLEECFKNAVTRWKIEKGLKGEFENG